MIPELGIIEGYFGRTWSWRARTAVVDNLGPAGYRFFHYAPKLDQKLRREWRKPHTKEEASSIQTFASHCRAKSVRFGIGLTPYDAHLSFDEATKSSLKAKLQQFDAWGIDDLALLFDDMRGDIPELATRQTEIARFVTDHSRATRFFFCPSYYSLDQRLDTVFGKRPVDYLHDLGKSLDPCIAVYWTGEEVCSPEIRQAHLQDIAEVLGRKVALWDNYPVNDGPRMSQFLHLRAFTGRSSEIADNISHHAINPASQPILGCIPALTLPMIYQDGASYRYSAAFQKAANQICGQDLEEALRADLLSLQAVGLNQMPVELKTQLRSKYAAFKGDAAVEIIDWLDGGYAIKGEQLLTQ
ncbi:beta-N-acetylglucosaminidase domain-containing protein [Aquidulcibacter paucihalophilus]|uniref:beta-N-acetylglucosaminidase domain-containing protein n=1 Tax=Aquidulcibacter paucihalophilus TaxID=1978549 RepID=UPI000A18B4D5|nr:beta-N-acetylglucosaminidase domain-containing protein [Aquidulcibacter paucihalophilus]